ncbi:hypothetical protein BMS3Bbin02_00014 [bacterium BMS3Bbin02]|nr:hypothetical protein BMS3Bbin02_00014 [bacterium BMS3Bbin02]
MPQLDHFRDWVPTSPFADEELAVQVQAYLQTFPGRTLQLIVELLEAPFLKQEESECQKTRSPSESPQTDLW